ncbi:uncharacterized protein LOC133259479 isoform X2 [Bos javanicus]|uniref:uncharacterized protein isoform X2 n=1 Tax=Bos taurus TaxID=9913 RepID=UPI000D535628|nr:uncharacterized protein LOC101909083 isoform X2 [Bos taurus]XP_061293035.1 uncharacterized protein LOC133259479 isoform X2 [Bos javanicus]
MTPQPLFRGRTHRGGPYKPKGKPKNRPAGDVPKRAAAHPGGAGGCGGPHRCGRGAWGMRRWGAWGRPRRWAPDPASQTCLPIFGEWCSPGRRAKCATAALARLRASLPPASRLACAGPATQPSLPAARTRGELRRVTLLPVTATAVPRALSGNLSSSHFVKTSPACELSENFLKRTFQRKQSSCIVLESFTS